MKRELEHFYVGDSYGGQQEWYPRLTEFGMYIGGCAAITACDCSIYFTKYFGRKLYPFDAQNISRTAYLEFGRIMEPYLYPRWSGVDRLEIYLDGYGRFLRDHKETSLTLAPWPGEKSYDDTREVVRRQIDAGFLIPCLILNHREPSLEDYNWHWFILNAYDERDGKFFVKAVTYGVGRWFDLRTLWDTGYQRRGGLILFGGLSHEN